MYEIPNHDRYLDPPDEPDHSACDGCGEIFDNGDLTKVGKYYPFTYLCKECYLAKEEEQL